MRFGTWNVKSLCRAGSLQTVSSELAKYNLDGVAVQEVRWVDGGDQPADNYKLFHENGNANHQLGTCFLYTRESCQQLKRVEFITDRMLYITLRGHWCDVLNVRAPTENKGDDTKDSFCEELEHGFDQFPKYHVKLLLGDFNAKVGR